MLPACLQIEHRKSNTPVDEPSKGVANCNQTITSGKVEGGEGRWVNNKNCVSGVASFSSVCIQSQTEEQKMSEAWEQGYSWGKNAPRFNSLHASKSKGVLFFKME